jgi:penicillin-binding protein 1A
VASSQYGPDDDEPYDHEHGDGRGPYGYRQHGYWRDDPGYRDRYGQPDQETTLPLPILDGPDDPRASLGSDGLYGPARPRRRGRRFLYRVTLTVATLAACLLIGFGILLLVTPSAGQATAIAARIAREHHEAYPGPAVPGNFARPLIATEDHRFYSDVGGMDPLALAHVAASAITGGPDEGGATIEVQLAKMLYVGADSPAAHTIESKLTEVALAVKLNAMYGKPRILRLYAEVAYYGHGYYGLQQASCGYFGHPPAGLTVTQGAMLAGIVNAPAYDDPIAHPAQARARLAHVIGRMVAVGYLTPEQGGAALSAPLHLTPGHSPNC